MSRRVVACPGVAWRGEAGAAMTHPHALEVAARDLAAASAVLRKVPAGRGRAAEELVHDAWRKVRAVPDTVRAFVEGSDDLAELDTYERVVRCRAVQLTEHAVVHTRNGWVDAEAGDWVVQDALGGLYTCHPVVFNARGTARRVHDDDGG